MTMWGDLFVAMLMIMGVLCLCEIIVYLIRRKR